MTDLPKNDDVPTAAMVAIGDELLSGRTKDANIHYLGGWLATRGVVLKEVRIVPDDAAAIGSAVNAVRGGVDYVFTSGGIGPTHDDITTDAIGAAFGADVEENEEALSVLAAWYAARGEEVTDGRRRMARIPVGGTLVANKVSGAPGFRLGNVFVFAGVPSIFQGMLDAVDDDIRRGPVYTVMTVSGQAKESELSAGLLALEQALKGLKIGSYPGELGRGSLAVVLKSADPALAERAAVAVEGLFRAIGAEPMTQVGYGEGRGSAA